jgi:serine/threonine-protein kinase
MRLSQTIYHNFISMNKSFFCLLAVLIFASCGKSPNTHPIAPVVPVVPQPVFSVLAGSGLQGSVDSKGINASFYYPVGLASDLNGNILVADSYNNKIRQIAPDGTVTTIAGTGMKGNDDGPALQATFFIPHDMIVDHSGNIYLLDLAVIQGNGQNIRKISTNGLVTTIPIIYNGRPLNRDYNVFKMDVSGNIFIADSEDLDVKEVSPSGLVTAIKFDTAVNIDGFAFDSSGNLFMSDNLNDQILELKTNGSILLFCKTFAQNTNGVNSQVNLISPSSIVIDKSGNLFLEDFGAIREITSNGVATTIIPNIYPDNNAGNFAHTNLMDALGNLYIPDRYNNKIRKIVFQH